MTEDVMTHTNICKEQEVYDRGYEDACIELFKILKLDDSENYKNKRALTTLECWLEDFEINKEVENGTSNKC